MEAEACYKFGDPANTYNLPLPSNHSLWLFKTVAWDEEKETGVHNLTVLRSPDSSSVGWRKPIKNLGKLLLVPVPGHLKAQIGTGRSCCVAVMMWNFWLTGFVAVWLLKVFIHKCTCPFWPQAFIAVANLASLSLLKALNIVLDANKVRG